MDEHNEFKMACHRAVGLFTLVRTSQSIDRRFVRHSRSIHSLSLKGEKNEHDKS